MTIAWLFLLNGPARLSLTRAEAADPSPQAKTVHQPTLGREAPDVGRFIQIPGPNPVLVPSEKGWDSAIIEAGNIFKDEHTYYLTTTELRRAALG